MTTNSKIKITSLSVILAFACQLIGSVWFLSGLSNATRLNTDSITKISTEVERRTEIIYSVMYLREDIGRINQELKEIKKELKEIRR